MTILRCKNTLGSWLNINAYSTTSHDIHTQKFMMFIFTIGFYKRNVICPFCFKICFYTQWSQRPRCSPLEINFHIGGGNKQVFAKNSLKNYVTQNSWTSAYCNLLIPTNTSAHQGVTACSCTKVLICVILEWVQIPKLHWIYLRFSVYNHQISFY